MIKRGDKNAQGLSTSAIILIILGVFVLVILIVGFTMGWNTLKERLMGSSSNVGKIAEACNLACSTDSVYDYCNMKRELKDEDGNTLKDVTCYMLSLEDNLKKYGISKCSSVDCKSIVKCGAWEYINNAGAKTSVVINTVIQTDKSSEGTNYCSKS
ncbi:MAG: hypothetical protein KKF67_00925 [Nanoarchaeota archaeon]|nr:hypothetical protein [Nanoarchaeota archaeon]